MSSIVVANSNPDYAKKIASALRSNGLYVGGICTTGAQVMSFTRAHYHGGVVISSIKLRDMSAVNLPRATGSGYDYLFLVGSRLAEMCESLEYACLILPVSRMTLISTVNMLLNLSDAVPLSLKKKLASGKCDEKQIVADAKGFLMERTHFTEAQAHRFIQKKSMDTGKRMAETAMIILNS